MKALPCMRISADKQPMFKHGDASFKLSGSTMRRNGDAVAYYKDAAGKKLSEVVVGKHAKGVWNDKTKLAAFLGDDVKEEG